MQKPTFHVTQDATFLYFVKGDYSIPSKNFCDFFNPLLVYNRRTMLNDDIVFYEQRVQTIAVYYTPITYSKGQPCLI